jgi:hypothetical protein
MGVSISNLEKAELIERFANLENHAVPQFDIVVQARTAQIEIAVAQTRFLARRHFVFDRERRRLRVVQNVHARRHHFHFARGNLGIGFLAADHASFYSNNKLRAQFFGLGVGLGMLLLVEDNLRDPRAVAQVDKNELSEVAPLVDPAHEDNVRVGVRRPQFTAVFCPLQISKCVEQWSLLSSGQ